MDPGKRIGLMCLTLDDSLIWYYMYRPCGGGRGLSDDFVTSPVKVVSGPGGVGGGDCGANALVVLHPGRGGSGIGCSSLHMLREGDPFR